MSPPVRKAVLCVHLTVSVGWIGSVLAYLAVGLTAARSEDVELIRRSWGAMESIGWSVIVPLAVAALVTGILMALGTRWGLLDHYWVLISLLLTTFATVVLVIHMGDVRTLAVIARTGEDQVVRGLGGDLLHTILGLLVVLTVQILNVYKPRGLTARGRRRLAPTRAAAAGSSAPRHVEDTHAGR